MHIVRTPIRIVVMLALTTALSAALPSAHRFLGTHPNSDLQRGLTGRIAARMRAEDVRGPPLVPANWQWQWPGGSATMTV